ncbi:hypothetical protein ACIPWE_38550 [Streptomyces sp. NPDC090073]|uniref:hypothetical protein n=1 Tax=Streptomyces sp. NPDC090073 TaxID=3365936 RepID=UPI00380825CD
MSDLPPFSGDNPRCAKCGMRGAHTEWVPYRPPVYNGRAAERKAQPEHLRRACIRCGYRWQEDIVHS